MQCWSIRVCCTNNQLGPCVQQLPHWILQACAWPRCLPAHDHVCCWRVHCYQCHADVRRHVPVVRNRHILEPVQPVRLHSLLELWAWVQPERSTQQPQRPPMPTMPVWLLPTWHQPALLSACVCLLCIWPIRGACDPIHRSHMHQLQRRHNRL